MRSLFSVVSAALLAASQFTCAQEVQLVMVGDVMLDELHGKAIARGMDPFAEFADILHAADAAVANLECVVATGGRPEPDKPYTFRASPLVLPVIARHFGIVSLANNHSVDFGHEAFLEQLALLDKHKIARFGGGKNCADARLPLILVIKGIRIALLGYNDFHPRCFEAGPNWPGVAWAVDEQITSDIEAARTIHKADLVIPVMHWGEEYEPANDRQRKLAHLMIEAGADMVIGGHPHVTQGAEYHRGKLILFSLGNFVFNGFDEGPRRTGWLLRLKLNNQGIIAWDTVVAHLDEEGIPHLKRDTASPSGIKGSDKIDDRRALIDSPLSGASKSSPAPQN